MDRQSPRRAVLTLAVVVVLAVAVAVAWHAGMHVICAHTGCPRSP